MTAKEQAEVLALLRELADHQNGVPLERYRAQYEETMRKVYAFLGKHEPKQEQ